FSNTTEGLATKDFSGVSYHNKRPKFTNEFKIVLPTVLNTKHHLLFTFYHVQCQKSKKDEKAEKLTRKFQVVLGHAILPLLSDLIDGGTVLKDESRSLPICTNFSNGYRENRNNEAYKWIDNKKGVFQVRTKLLSTVHCQDEHIHQFFSLYDRLHNHNEGTPQQVAESLDHMRKANGTKLIQLLPIVMKKTLTLLCEIPVNAAEQVFSHLIALVDKIYNETKNNVLESWLTFVFDNEVGEKVPLYQRLCQVWSNVIRSREDQPASLEGIFQYSWFFFGIITKSMILFLHKSGTLSGCTGSSSTFSADAIASLHHIIRACLKSVKILSSTTARQLNNQVAYFLKDQMSILNRSTIFKLIYAYVGGLEQGGQPLLIEMKFSCMKIINDHEHYVAFNSPQMKADLGPPSDILRTFWQKHFLVGLMLQEINSVFVKGTNDHDLSSLSPAMDTLKTILYKHNFDARYANDPEMIKTIIAMYFPFLITVVDNLKAVTSCNLSDRRNIFLCWLYVLKHIPRTLLQDWWRADTTTRKLNFWDCLQSAVDVFEYKRKPEEVIMSPNLEDNLSPTTILKKKKSQKPEKKRFTVIRSKDSDNHIENSSSRPTTPPSAPSSPSLEARPTVSSPPSTLSLLPTNNSRRESHLGKEVSFVVLDTLLLFVKDFRDNMMVKHSTLLKPVFETMCLFLTTNQAVRFLTAANMALTNLIVEFRKPLFRYAHNLCGELCYQTIRHCNFRLRSPRIEATTLLYILISNNYKEMKNFSRTKLQTGISISNLAGETTDFTMLTESLSIVVSRGHSGKFGTKFNNTLPEQVEEMVNRLFGVMRDSQKMKESSWDPERHSELFYQISKGFTDSPDLRLTWLSHLANFHEKNENFEELALVKIFMAALVSGYMNLANMQPKNFPREYTDVYKNINREMLMPQSSVLESLEGEVCVSKMFTEQGFINLLMDSIRSLEKAKQWENCVEVYQSVQTIFHNHRNFIQLERVYSHLNLLCRYIVGKMDADASSASNQSTRLFPLYYRVAFYGTKLQELNGQEYIYKEPGGLRLAEFKEKIERQFKNRFGEEYVKPVSNMEKVDKLMTDAEFCHIQIISVRVWLPPHELKTKITPFEQNFGVERFEYNVPFTMSGKAQGSVSEQYQKKTIITTDSVFPYIQKRLLVVKKEEFTLTPIEASTEVLQGQIVKIKRELTMTPPNSKTLTMELSGSLMAQVNGGPLEICKVFLGDNMTKYNKAHVHVMIETFHQLIEAIDQALQLNANISGPEGMSFHRSLCESFRTHVAEFNRYMPLEEESEEE
ncbi:dedicator of cytokinesis 9, partial [Planoprotostelium fungivorum]